MNNLKVLLNKGNNASPRYIPIYLNLAYDEAEDKSYPYLKTFSSKTYLAWAETVGGTDSDMSIRVAVYDDVTQTFSFVDGNGARGIYSSTPRTVKECQLFEFDSKLYLIFSEIDNSDNKELHVFVYNGNDLSPTWTKVSGSGIQEDTTSNVLSLAQFVELDSKLYAVWNEGLSFSPTEVVIKVYNGNDISPSWTLISDGSLNLGGAINYISTAVSNGKLYISWSEILSGPLLYTYVVVYNGDDGDPAFTRVDNHDIEGLVIVPNTYCTKPGLFNRNDGVDDLLYIALTQTFDPTELDEYDLIVAKYNNEDESPVWVQDNNETRINNYNDGNYIPRLNQTYIKNQEPYIPYNEYVSSTKSNIRLATGDDPGTPLSNPTDSSELVNRFVTFLSTRPSKELEMSYTSQGNFILYSLYDSGLDETTIQAYLADLAASIVDISPVGGLQTNTTPIQAFLNPIEHDSKLYAFALEDDGTGDRQFIASVWDGNTVTPGWTSVVGDLTSYIGNVTAFKVFVFDSKLYVFLVSDNGTTSTITLLKYNDNDVSPSYSVVDSGWMSNDGIAGNDFCINIKAIEYKSKMYVFLHREARDTSKSYIEGLVYNGNDVSPSFADIYSNDVAAEFKLSYNLTVSQNSTDAGDERLYLIYSVDAGADFVTKVEVYNGNDPNPSWINANVNNNFSVNSPKVDISQMLNYKVYGINSLSSAIQLKFYNNYDFSPSWFDPSLGNTSIAYSPSNLIYLGKVVRSYNGGGDLQSILIPFVQADYACRIVELRLFIP